VGSHACVVAVGDAEASSSPFAGGESEASRAVCPRAPACMSAMPPNFAASSHLPWKALRSLAAQPARRGTYASQHAAHGAVNRLSHLAPPHLRGQEQLLPLADERLEDVLLAHVVGAHLRGSERQAGA
jgi:hypothetical protein